MSGATTCAYFTNCQPSDHALAAGAGRVLEGVNASFNLYTYTGGVVAGWPKTAQAFFGIPNEPNNCDPDHGNKPFLTDPRAIYDPNTQRFFAAILQVEGAFGRPCPHLSGYWIAVSQTSDPNGAWFVYFIDWGFVTGAANATDFTMMGLSPKSLDVGGDVYDNSGFGVNTNNFIFPLPKAALESGGGFGISGFVNLTVGGTLMNTVQPVLSLGGKVGPDADLFAASFDEHFNTSCSAAPCSGIELFAIGNPLNEQGHGQVFSGVTAASSKTYSFPPNAPDGTAADTVDTGDVRISGTPVYKGGTIWGTLNTNYKNATQNVPGIYWFQIQPVLNHGISGCSLCVSLVSASMVQNAYFAFGGSNSNYYGSIMPDLEGNIFMVSNYSTASGVHPSVIYESRRATEGPNKFSDGGQFVFFSSTATIDDRWGDYTAATWDGPAGDRVFIAGSYASATGWTTRVGRVGYSLTGTS